jgi:hypothetical protein
VVTPPHRKFKKNVPDWYEGCTSASAKHLVTPYPVEHGIAHLRNWRALTRHLGRQSL